MRKIAFLSSTICLLFISVFNLSAQLNRPLKWSVSSAEVDENVFELTAKAVLPDTTWHIYDLQEYEGGPNPTVFRVEGEGFELIGEPRIDSPVHRYYDDIFGMEIGVCSGTVVIRQKLKLAGGDGCKLKVHIEWQCCNDSSCLPPDEFDKTLSIESSTRGRISSSSTGSDSSTGGNAGNSATAKSLIGLVIAAVAWGFAALLTPCVFPMIPMTVSFFLKRNTEVEAGNRNEMGRKKRRSGKWLALFFGLSIVLLYTVPVTVLILISLITGGQAVTADIFNWLATHWLPNLLFFAVFMLFAASFFGAFEIVLPSRLINRSDVRSNAGGMSGAFFVALTLVLVSFSCTGPIVGSVLIKSTQGQFWEPIVTMLAFSLAFAVPFTVLAFAPSLLKKMPKSGGWLNSVKVVLGFIEMALGFKFLSVADQTYHWGLLDREVYLAIWIVIFTLLGLYLLGKIRFAGDTPVDHLSVKRLVLSIATFTFVVYMVPGMWGAPLKALSGYLPPITTQDFVLGEGNPGTVSVTGSVPGSGLGSVSGSGLDSGQGSVSASAPSRKYSDFLKLPYGLPAFFDYDEALEYAKSVGKPLLVDFTGHGCVNCREMETRVWSDPRVLGMMRDDYVICALYADDKKVVDEKDWVTTPDGKVLRNLGKINSYFALTRFNVNAQPYYVILDPFTQECKLPSRGYDLDVEAFVGFLKAGLAD